MSFIEELIGEDGKGQVDGLSRVFDALSVPVRLILLCMIAEGRGELAVEDLVARLGELGFTLAQPTVSHHLQRLAWAGLIVRNKWGTRVYYALNRNEGALSTLSTLSALATGLKRLPPRSFS